MLTPADALAIAESFGLGARASLTGPVAAGRLGQVWLLTTPQGRYAVKEPFFPVSATDARADAAFQDVVRAAGVPMPAVVRTPGGEVLAPVGGAQVRLYEYVDVLPGTPRLDPVAVGRLLARLHQVVVSAATPVDAWHTDPVGRVGWERLVRELSRAGAPFATRLDRLVPDLLAVEALLTPPAAAQLCHCDLWSDNLVSTPTGELMVLDWENAGAADPRQELGMVVYEYGCGEPERMRELYDAYVAAGGPGRLDAPGDLTMLVATLGHIAEEGCRRWLAADTDAARADNAAWVAEFLDDPVTVATVEHLLGAVRGTRPRP
ncbi:phosphotransferase enzyme family protein [Nocardioides sp.]|uniref:phosphotransferase enzyme family protein n=1 Tax=Nocardioides sp. TaxID=35761 RepID=UPI003D0FF95F